MGVYDYHDVTAQERLQDARRAALRESRGIRGRHVEVTPDNPYKAYVSVVAQFTSAGEMVPLSITWEDGRTYEIDRVQDVARMASRRAGGAGVRYLCMILGNPVELYYEENGMWFVTRKEATCT